MEVAVKEGFRETTWTLGTQLTLKHTRISLP